MRVHFWRMNVLPRVSSIGSGKFRRFILDLLPWKDVHNLCDMADYMYSLGTEIYESKKRALERGDEIAVQQIGRGKDLISTLSMLIFNSTQENDSLLKLTVKENMKASDDDQLKDSEVISQVAIA